MIPRIKKAEIVKSNKGILWLVWFDGYNRTPRLIPGDENPSICPGGVWCDDFGCEEAYKNVRH